MAIVKKLGEAKLLRSPAISTYQSCAFSFSSLKGPWLSRKAIYLGIGLAGTGLGALIYTLDKSVAAYDFPCHAPNFGFRHRAKYLNSFDHASIRRGYEVYRNVCSACHSMEYLPFRRLVNVAYSEEEMKQIASETMIHDGPDDTGAYFQRPGKLSDYFPSPYPNEEAAKYANNGAAPPDFSTIVLAREGGENYIYAILTGYSDEVPAGVQMEENAYYNPYFQGSIIAMAPPLYNGIIEYSDGTPATLSQLAKDVVTFLAWTSEPELDLRKLWVIKFNMWVWFIAAFVWYLYRHKWTTMRTRRIIPHPSLNLKPKDNSPNV